MEENLRDLYLNEPSRCPECQADSVNVGDMIYANARTILVNISCSEPTCNFSAREVYTLIGLEDDNYVPLDGEDLIN